MVGEISEEKHGVPHRIPSSNKDMYLKIGSLLLLLFMEAASFGMLMPLMPVVTTEYFARKYMNVDFIDCTKNAQSDACLFGSKQADWWLSISSSMGSVLLFLFSPIIGASSDMYGRKPFLVLNHLLCVGIPFTVLHFAIFNGAIWPYFCLRLVTSAYGSTGVITASIADVVSPKDRAVAFGFVMATFNLGFSTGSGLSTAFLRYVVFMISAGLYCCRLFWAVFLLYETLPVSKRSVNEECSLSPFGGIRILFRSKLFLRLTAMACTCAFVNNGIQSYLVFFLNTSLGFDGDDIAKLMIIYGFESICAQFFLLKPLMACLREKGIIILAITGNMAEAIGDIFAAYLHQKNIIYFSTALSTVGNLSFAAVTSILSNNSSVEEQGQLQGSIFGIRALFEAVGPLVYAYMYSHATKESIFSQALPLHVSVVLYFFGILIACKIPSRLMKRVGAESSIVPSSEDTAKEATIPLLDPSENEDVVV